MISVSELGYINRRISFYIDTIRSYSFKDIFRLDTTDQQNYLASMQIMLMRRSQLIKVSPKFVINLNLIMLRYAVKLSSWDRDKMLISVSIMLLSFIINVWLGLSYMFVLMYFLLILINKKIEGDIVDVINIQKEVVIDKYINLSIGNQPIDLLLAGEYAVELINEYSDEILYQIAYGRKNEVDLLSYAYDQYKDFIEKHHLKKLFDSGGRYFEIGSVITLIYSTLQVITSDISRFCIVNKEVSASSKEALKLLQENDIEIIELKKFVKDWVQHNLYELDYLDSLNLTQLMVIILVSKDELYLMNEKFSFYDTV